SGEASAAWGVCFDSISICLSKGLGAPVGSVLVGSKDLIREARRVRKRFGGGMRQAGVIAAAGLYALDHHVQRLVDDHARAKRLGDAMAGLPYVESVMPVQTNIVITTLKSDRPVDGFLSALRERGVIAVQLGPSMVRMVTHLDVDDAAIDRTIGILVELAA
ncbi:MAG TPA: beta-eliminating lyase-related protein, partial [Flavobacteriales bacterium]|nr:beta-eliminating lyase-related protein [Flavobacteriales bacterium]